MSALPPTSHQPPSTASCEASSFSGYGAESVRWFSEEVHAHGAQLRSYLRGQFPAVRDVEDVVQESYLRIWKARAAEPIHSVRAFLFKVARNVALNLLAHQRVSPIDAVADLSTLPVTAEEPGTAEAACTHEEIQLLAEGIDTLPARCREIFILRRLKGVSQKEIAARLGISEQTVQVQVQRGVKRCEEFLRHRGVKRN